MFFHHLNELLKEVIAVVRTGRRFGMVLNAKHRQFTVTEALIRSVV